MDSKKEKDVVNENSNITVVDHLIIKDKQSNKIIVNKRA